MVKDVNQSLVISTLWVPARVICETSQVLLVSGQMVFSGISRFRPTLRLKLGIYMHGCGYVMRLAAYDFSVFEYHAETHPHSYIRIPSLFIFGCCYFPYPHTHMYPRIWIPSLTLLKMSEIILTGRKTQIKK